MTTLIVNAQTKLNCKKKFRQANGPPELKQIT